MRASNVTLITILALAVGFGFGCLLAGRTINVTIDGDTVATDKPKPEPND